MTFPSFSALIAPRSNDRISQVCPKLVMKTTFERYEWLSCYKNFTVYYLAESFLPVGISKLFTYGIGKAGPLCKEKIP